MRCTVVLEFDDGTGMNPRRVELMRLHRQDASAESGDVGISLIEGKTLLQTVQQEFVVEQLSRFCVRRRPCEVCGAVRLVHDSHCSTLKTVFGAAFYCRDRWKACACGADRSRYVSPFKEYLVEATTSELRWLHASLGAMMPYRQAMRVVELLLPTSGRDNHVTLRNHTLAVGAAIQRATPPGRRADVVEPVGELGIDVGYVRKVEEAVTGEHPGRRKDSSSIAIVVAALRPVGKAPKIWASAMPRSKGLQTEMTKFLADSGYGSGSRVRVLTDAAKDLSSVTNTLPQASGWVLDWAHIGRLLRHVGQTLGPLAYGRLTPTGSAFELWDLFVRFRSYVWTGKSKRWKRAGDRLYELLELREERDPENASRARAARHRLMNVLCYLEANIDSLIDYRRWQQGGRRISTGFVESAINRLVGRRMCKGQHMRWSRAGAPYLVQARAAILNQEF